MHKRMEKEEHMQRQGQITVGFLGGVVVLVILFAFFAPIIGEWGQTAITNGNLTGTTALLFANINFFIVIGIFLMILAYATFAGGG